MGWDTQVYQALSLCQRMDQTLSVELRTVEQELIWRARRLDAITRPKTIPSVGDRVAVMLYAWIGKVERFGSAKGVWPQASWVGVSETVG